MNQQEEQVKEQFIDAVKQGDKDKIRDLLEGSPYLQQNINEPWFAFDAPAIVYIAGRGDRALIDLLLEYGADINAKSRWWAGSWGVLHSIANYQGLELAPYLLQRGALLDAHSAAGLGMLDELREMLLADPSLANARGPDGMTPLHFARTPEIAGLLLNYGADINARDLDHQGTPAQWAIGNRPDICRFLIERGAEADIFLFCALGEMERVQALLQSNPEIVHSWTQGEAPGGHIYAYTIGMPSTPLHVAARFNQCEIARLLLEAGSDLTAPGPHGGTPLHWAAWYGYRDMVRLLLEHGALLEVTCKDFGSTPLGWAAHGSRHCNNPQGDYVAVVEDLLKAGASVYAPGNRSGATIASLASDAIAGVLHRWGG